MSLDLSEQEIKLRKSFAEEAGYTFSQLSLNPVDKNYLDMERIKESAVRFLNLRGQEALFIPNSEGLLEVYCRPKRR